MLFTSYKRRLTGILSLGLLVACGARTKTASDVAGMFGDANGQTLGFILTGICENLRSREQAPNMARASLTTN